MSHQEGKPYQQNIGFDDTAGGSHNYPAPPSYPGPPPSGYGVHPVVLQPQYAGPSYQHVQMVQGPGVTYVTTGGPNVVQGGVATVIVPSAMGTRPTSMTCRSCGSQIITRVETKPTLRTHLCAALLCILFCWPCVCVPYCMDSCMTAEHYCPSCNAYMGKSYD